MSERPASSSDRNSISGKQSRSQAVADDSIAPTLKPQSREPQNPETIKSSSGSSVAGSNKVDGEQHVDVGTELGYYRLLKKLGEGGMGSVWQAVHTKLDKHVAVKVLPATWSRDPALLTRFEREMKAVGKLEHPNIVRAMDAGEFNGTHYLVMEFNEGLDLSAYIKQRGPQSVTNACEMLRHAAIGLAHAHEAGLIHRDIKPSNLFLTKSGKVKILDLGLARVQGDTSGGGQTLTGFGQVLGTPDYMAPEQWENTHAVDGRSDLYALGCTLFYLLTGRAPFSDEKHSSLVGKMKGHTLDPIPDLKAAREAAVADRPKLIFDLISDELDALYRRLMAKRPEERFASANDLAQALAVFGKTSGSAATSAVLVKGRGSADERSPVAPRQESRTSLNATSAIDSQPKSNTPPAPGNPVAERQGYGTTAPLMMTDFESDAPTAAPVEASNPSFFAMLTEQTVHQHDAPASGSSSTQSKTQLDHSLARRAGGAKLKPAWIGGAVAAVVLLVGLAGFFLRGNGGSTESTEESSDEVVTETKEKPKRREVAKVDSDAKSVRLANKEDADATAKAPAVRPASDLAQPAVEWKGWPADGPKPAIAPFDAEQAKKHQEEWAAYLKVPVEYENSIGMKFRLIPPGEFTMGMTKEEAEAVAAQNPSDPRWQEWVRGSAPEHGVRLTQAYYLGKYEVTQEQYEKVMGTNPSSFSTTGAEKDKIASEDTKQHPVEMVSYSDAADFCIKLSNQEKLKPVYLSANGTITLIPGDGYRLPTEAEWEYACRAGTNTAWFHGEQESTIGTVAWFKGNSGGLTHSVGQLKSNPFGLYDVHGNVWEWCQDWYDVHAYTKRGADITENPQGPDAGAARVVRGGDWYYDASYCHSALRVVNGAMDRNYNRGFRLSAGVDAARAALNASGVTKSEIASETKPKSANTKPMPKEVASLTPNKTAPIKRPAIPLAPKVTLAKEAFKSKPGTPISPRAMVWSPAPIKDLASWSVELVSHYGGVSNMAVSPDGEFVATVSGGDDSIHIWRINEEVNPPTITLDRVLLGESGAILDVAWSPDGQALAVTTHFGRNVAIYDAANGRKLMNYSLEGEGGHNVRWSPDGRWLAVGTGHVVMIDPVLGKTMRSKVGLNTHDLCWSSDGRQLATLDQEGKLKIWSPIKLEPVAEVVAFNQQLNRLAWSPDGRWFATGGVAGHLKLWDATSRRVIHDLSGEHGEVYGLAWEPNPPEGVAKHPSWPRLVSFGGHGTIWDPVQGKKLLSFSHGGNQGAWSPDGQRIISVSGDNRVALTDPESGRLVAHANPLGVANIQGWSSHTTPDGKILRVLNGQELLIFDGERGEYVKRIGNMPQNTMMHSPKDDWLAIYDDRAEKDQIVLVDTATYEQRRPLNGHVGKVTGVNWSPDAKSLASSGYDGLVCIWKVSSGEVTRQIKHDRAVRNVVWSPDGKSVATCAEDDVIRIFNADSGKELKRFDPLPAPPAWGPTGIAWAPVGDLIAIAGWDAQARVLDIKGGKLSEPFISFQSSMNSVAWSTDGKQLLVSNGNEIGYRAVAAKSSQFVYGHGLPLHWLNDKRRVLTGQGGGHPLQAVDTRRGSRLGVLFPSLVGGGWVCIGPDGHYRGSEDIEKHIVYVALHKDGSQSTHSAAEFREKYGWKNDPAKATLLKIGGEK